MVLVAALVVALVNSLPQTAAENRIAADSAGGELVIFHAGSLAVPFREVSARFNEMYPNVRIKAEAAGSRDSARKISDLGRSCDVLGSADYRVIDTLLMPRHAVFNIRFATNEMVIAYTPDSSRADAISADNWPEVLLDEGVAFGRADPNRDPCGYRTVMVFQLAERYYKIPGLARALQDKHRRRYIRPKETDLLALLEVGEIDFLFIYRSVALQHGLEFVPLPDEVNLESPELAGLYATAEVQLSGNKPGELLTRKGAPMVYGVTIPSNSPNRELAEKWVGLLLSSTGRDIMKRNGQPPIAPPRTAQFERLPQRLRSVCRPIGDGD